MLNTIKKKNIFFILALLGCLLILTPYLIPILIGISLAYLYEPLLEKIIYKYDLKKEIWKIIISLFLVVLTLAAIIAPFLTLISSGFQELSALINSLDTDLKNPNFIKESSDNLSVFLDKFSIHYTSDELLLKGTEILKKAGTFLVSWFGTAITGTPGMILKFIIFILTWFFFLIYGKHYRNIILPKIIPWEKERILIGTSISAVLKALIVANVLVSSLQAILITSSLAFFGIPRFALLGIIAFFSSFIPIIGTAPIMLGAAAWCYFSQGRLGATIGIILCSVLISIVDNLMRPLLMKGGVNLNFFWMFLAILGGMSQFGIVGAVLGPAFFTLFIAFLKYDENDNNAEIVKQIDENPPNP
ncbi:AI-2E family transporter [Pigmentibacter ruber]|uniref:AI-2E family transporter n=1 Tax=Pigmentibacter ruber TaxID=2683196 RepID=UPI00131E0028|nr:AI-2E family transporter [Pigmentibacter ruber]BFD33192.1 AI-2E family transporter [Pigmentibacter ruber]